MALTDSLISYWKLDEASGTRYDSHGTNHLTDNNTVGSATGKINNAADFEVDNLEYLSIADNTDMSTGDIDFTFSCWVNFETSGIRTILGKTADINGSSSNMEYVLYLYSDDKIYWNIARPDALGEVVQTYLGTGTWHFLVAWHDSAANTVNLQLNNGTVNSSSFSGGPSDTSYSFFIGNGLGFSGTRRMDGLIDEVGFWKRVLTSDERTQLYNGGRGLAYSFNSSNSILTKLYYNIKGFFSNMAGWFYN